jgi:hypothetical protein
MQVDVKHENDMEMRKLASERVVYVADDMWATDFHKRMVSILRHRPRLASATRFCFSRLSDQRLPYKVGASVLFTAFKRCTNPR